MNVKKNITIENISKISQDSIDYLKTFKEYDLKYYWRTLQGKNKRVPKIIDLFIEKKRQKYLTDRPKWTVSQLNSCLSSFFFWNLNHSNWSFILLENYRRNFEF